MAKARLGASYWQVIPTIEGLEKAIEEEVKGATGEGYNVPVEPVVETDKLDDDMGEAGDKSGKLFGGNFKAAFVASGAILAIGALAGKALYDVGATFDDMNDAIQIGTGASGAKLEELKDVASNIFTSIPTTTAIAGQAVADLNTRLGLTGDDLEGVAKQVIEAGRLLNEEVDVNALGGAFSQFRIEADQMEGALDSVFRTSQDTGVGFNSLLNSVELNAAGLKSLGLNFEQSASLIGQLDKAGLEADTTIAQMGKGIVTLAKDGQPAQEAIANVVGQIKNLVDAGNETEAIDLASTLFGTRGALNVVNAIDSGVISMESFNGAVSDTGNTILGVAEDTNDFAEKWQVLQNKGMEAIEPLASAVFDLAATILEDATPALDFLIDVVSNMAIFFAENEWAIGAVASVIGGALVVALVAATAAAWAFVAPILANPLTWIILGAIVAIGLLIAAFSWLVANWDGVVQFFADSITNIGNFFGSMGEALGNFFGGIGNFIMDVFTNVGMFVLGIINSIIDAANSIISFIPNLFGAGWSGPLGNISLPGMAEGGTVLPTAGGTVAVLAEAGRAETIVDTGHMNSLIEGILTGSIGTEGAGNGAPIFNMYITQKEDQSMKDFIEELTKEIQFQLTGGSEYSYA